MYNQNQIAWMYQSISRRNLMSPGTKMYDLYMIDLYHHIPFQGSSMSYNPG